MMDRLDRAVYSLLLTARAAWPQVMDRLTGRKPLPWEEELPIETRAQLGILGPTIIAMLDRNPKTRITIRQLLDNWSQLFQSAAPAPVSQ